MQSLLLGNIRSGGFGNIRVGIRSKCLFWMWIVAGFGSMSTIIFDLVSYYLEGLS